MEEVLVNQGVHIFSQLVEEEPVAKGGRIANGLNFTRWGVAGMPVQHHFAKLGDREGQNPETLISNVYFLMKKSWDSLIKAMEKLGKIYLKMKPIPEITATMMNQNQRKT